MEDDSGEGYGRENAPGDAAAEAGEAAPAGSSDSGVCRWSGGASLGVAAGVRRATAGVTNGCGEDTAETAEGAGGREGEGEGGGEGLGEVQGRQASGATMLLAGSPSSTKACTSLRVASRRSSSLLRTLISPPGPCSRTSPSASLPVEKIMGQQS